MSRFLAALLTASVVAGFAAADIAPPPPPKGMKYANVASEVKLGKDVKGYVFVTTTWTALEPPMRTRVEPTDTKAVAVTAGGRRRVTALFAVPEEAAKEYKSDKELFDALAAKKVKGVQSLEFNGTATISDTVKGDTVTWTYTITGIDDKGIKTDVSGDGAEAKSEKKEEKKRQALLDQPGYLIGGLAAAVAVTLGGLWLLRRKK